MKKRIRDAELLFEASFLKKIYRTGYPYLGRGKESVAAHSFGVAFVAWMLCTMCEKEQGKGVLDREKVLKMALLHDLPEARIGDFNAVNKLYDQADEERALKEAVSGTLLEEEVVTLWQEYRKGESLEAKLVHDADVIDLLLQLKEHADLGNPYAPRWIDFARKRLLTSYGKELATKVLETEWCSWWFEDLVEGNDS